jgi:phage terminase large subunit GpA-like protein
VWRELEDSTWEEYWVPCPHCGEYQTLRWRDGEEDEDTATVYRLQWDKDEEGRVIRGTTRYVCEHCGCLIDERYKQRMLEQGEWRARFPGRPTVGFHINTLYSPLCRWDTIAEEFLKAKKSSQEMKTFVNTFLGLPYRE